jgi:hypothetical protein
MSSATVGSIKESAKLAKNRMENLKDQMSGSQQFVINNKIYKSKRLLGEGI